LRLGETQAGQRINLCALILRITVRLYKFNGKRSSGLPEKAPSPVGADFIRSAFHLQTKMNSGGGAGLRSSGILLSAVARFLKKQKIIGEASISDLRSGSEKCEGGKIVGTLSREIRLAHRPIGLPRESDFELAEVRIPEPGKEEVLVRNIYMSVDPYMRGRMIDRPSYVPPFQIGEPLAGACVGQVVASRSAMFQAGDYVSGAQGWREYYVGWSSPDQN
jgi:hypothetical protein